MFADTGDDRYVYLGIVRVPQRVEPAGPRRDVARIGEKDHDGEDEGANEDHQAEEQLFQISSAWQLRVEIVAERVRLQKREDTCGEHVFTRANRLKADEWDLHGQNQAQNEEDRVGHVQTQRVPAKDDQHEHVHRNEIDDEDIATPGRDLKGKTCVVWTRDGLRTM